MAVVVSQDPDTPVVGNRSQFAVQRHFDVMRVADPGLDQITVQRLLFAAGRRRQHGQDPRFTEDLSDRCRCFTRVQQAEQVEHGVDVQRHGPRADGDRNRLLARLG